MANLSLNSLKTMFFPIDFSLGTMIAALCSTKWINSNSRVNVTGKLLLFILK